MEQSEEEGAKWSLKAAQQDFRKAMPDIVKEWRAATDKEGKEKALAKPRVTLMVLLDNATMENGCLQILPGSQDWPLLCTTKADITQSFSPVTVPVPEGYEATSIVMDAGDVLFFNGSVVHGSGPNHSADRFRRSLIGHYIAGEAQQAGQIILRQGRAGRAEAQAKAAGQRA